MPGIVDHHVHIGLSDVRAVLLGGVTAVRDLGWPPEEIFPLADISAGTDFDGPEIRAVGPMLTAPEGYPSRAGWAPEGTALEVEGPEEGVLAVERLAGDDAVAIKVALNADAGPTLSDAALLSICEAAHARRLPVTAHVQGPGETERALGAGVDEFAHCPWTERLSDELVEGMAKRVRIVSTLDIHSYGERTKELEVAVDNLFRFSRAGGTVRYGTDLGNGPIAPGMHLREVQELQLARLSPGEILAAMTAWRLEEGNPADLVALGANPFEDIEGMADLRLVVRMGRVRLQSPGR